MPLAMAPTLPLQNRTVVRGPPGKMQPQVKRWADITPSAMPTPMQWNMSSTTTFGMPRPLDLSAALERGPSSPNVEAMQTWPMTPTPSAAVFRYPPVAFGMSGPSLPFEPQTKVDGLVLQTMPQRITAAPISPRESPNMSPRNASPAVSKGDSNDKGSSARAGQQLLHEAIGSSSTSETYQRHVKNTFIDFEDDDAAPLVPKSVSAPNVFSQVSAGPIMSSLQPMQPIREYANSGHCLQNGQLVQMQHVAQPLAQQGTIMTLPYTVAPTMVVPAPPSMAPPLAPTMVFAPSGLQPPSAMAPPNVPGGYPGPARVPSVSRGSDLHGTGRCRPCAWYWKGHGCQHMHECGYCHLCPEGELQNRKKAKVNAMRAGALQPQPVGSRPGAPRVVKLSLLV